MTGHAGELRIAEYKLRITKREGRTLILKGSPFGQQATSVELRLSSKAALR